MSNQYLLAITLILISYVTLMFASRVFQKSKGFPLLHPLITASIVLITTLYFFDIDTQIYIDSTQILIYMLGPATVALGVPLYNNFSKLMKYKRQLILPLMLGAIASPLFAVSLLAIFNIDPIVLKSMFSKAITSPIAIDITLLLNGIPALAVLFVLASGITGAAFATNLFSVFKIKSDISKGIAIGVSAHAIGTARAVQISEECAAFSVIAMCINGITAAVVVVIYVSVI